MKLRENKQVIFSTKQTAKQQEYNEGPTLKKANKG